MTGEVGSLKELGLAVGERTVCEVLRQGKVCLCCRGWGRGEGMAWRGVSSEGGGGVKGRGWGRRRVVGADKYMHT